MKRKTHAWPTLFPRRLALLLALLAAASARAESPASPLAVTFGPEGPDSIRWNGQEMLQKQPFNAAFQFPGDKAAALAKPTKTEGTGPRIVRQYERATVTTVYRQEGDKLLLDLSVRNNAAEPLTVARLSPLAIAFPVRPRGLVWRYGYSMMASSYGEPGFAIADWGQGVLAVCNEDPLAAYKFGFAANHRLGTANPVVVENLGNSEFDVMPIAPGTTAEFHLSLRFQPGGCTADALVGDVCRAYAAAFPATLEWSDHRPIAALFLARDNVKWDKNPRGWFSDEKLDVATPAGQEKMRQKLLAYADTSIKNIQAVGGQGMITWDIEGAEFGNSVTYMGDPRALPLAAPEMDALADLYFKKFRDAGLKTGVCLRPTTIVAADPVNTPWIKTRLGHRDDGIDPVENLCDKIAYAKKRWGCTLFYIDTPGLYIHRDGKTNSYLLPARVLRAVHQRHPDVLLAPEYGPTGLFGVGSRYGEFAGSRHRTNDLIRLTYPKAFTLWLPKDDPLYPHWDEVVQGVENGDILLFQAWYQDAGMVRVRQAYAESRYRGQPLTPRVQAAGKDVAALVAALGDADAVTRYQAARALGAAKDPAAVAPLLKTLRDDAEWPVQRMAVASLGLLGGAEAVRALEAELVRPKSELSYFAGVALGDAQATAALERAMRLADAKRWEAVGAGVVRTRDAALMRRVLAEPRPQAAGAKLLVLESLKQKPEPALLDAVLPLLSDGPANVRTRAAEAAGACKDPRAIEPLLAILENPDKELYNAKHAAMFALEDITGYDGTVPGKTTGGENAAAWRKRLEHAN